MKRNVILYLAILVMATGHPRLTGGARAQSVHDDHQEAAGDLPLEAVGGLGSISFENSGAPDAQEAFLQGVLLLHSFEYADARAAFREARQLDPGFALAYWGEAMTHNHPLWAEQDREAARAVLAELAPTPDERRTRAPTPREKGFLEAVEQLYGDGDKATRDAAYRASMQRLHEAYPDDLEVAAFYALSILGSVPARDFRTYMAAAAVAEEVFARNPDHPGAAHYLIHSYDDPIHAPLGLRAARRYAGIAPAASHAQHMISHIYTALGEWDEVVEANEKAVAVSEDRLRRLDQPLARRNKHALLWLMYGLLQQGRFDEARAKLDTMDADAQAEPGPGQIWHHAAMRAAYVVEDPLRDGLPTSLQTARTLPAVSMDAFGTGFQAAARGDTILVRQALTEIRETIAAAVAATPEGRRSTYDGGASEDDRLVADIMARQLEAILAFKSGNTTLAVAILTETAADEAARPLEYGPPTVPKPSDELLGEMLLTLGRPEEAAVHFQKSLERNTRRALSLAGLARAAAQAGDTKTASDAQATLDEMLRGKSPGEAYPWLDTP